MLSNSWQPNFFRPTVRIGGVDVAGNISNTNIEQTFHNKSIGLPLPYCLTINKVIKEPKSIEIFCSLAQAYKKTGAWFCRNYPVLAIVNFWYKSEN